MENDEVYQVVYRGDIEFEGSRQDCSIYLLSHGLSRYYRGKRVLNLGVEMNRVRTSDAGIHNPDPQAGSPNSKAGSSKPKGEGGSGGERSG